MYFNVPPFESDCIVEQVLTLLKSWWLEMELKVDLASIIIHEGWVNCPAHGGCMPCVNMNLHTLQTFIIRFWAQCRSVTTVTAFTSSDHILSDDICYWYWQTTNRGDTLVYWHTHGWSVAHSLLLVLVIDTNRDILEQHSVRGGLTVMITGVPLGHTVDERPLQVSILLIYWLLDEEGPHEICRLQMYLNLGFVTDIYSRTN